MTKLTDKIKSTKMQTPPHMVIQALAGTGKTTTLIEGLKLLKQESPSIEPSEQQQAIWNELIKSDPEDSMCFCAFNKAIATELQDRVPEDVDAMTMHSMGYKSVLNHFGKLKAPSGWRTNDIIAELLGKDIREIRKTKMEVLRATTKLVSLCKMNLLGIDNGVFDLLEELPKLASHYDVELNGHQAEIFDLVPRVLERALDVDRDGYVDFDDMIWLPIALALPVRKYDLFLVDECFPAGTFVETSEGEVPIEKIVENPNKDWEVLTRVAKGKTLGYSGVVSAYKTPIKSHLVKVTHEKGEITCTANHPFWVEEKGWIPAGLLKEGDTLSYLQKTGEEGISELLQPMRGKVEKIDQRSKSRSVETEENFQEDERGEKRDSKPYGEERNQRESFQNDEGKRAHLVSERREWEGSNTAATSTISRASETASKMALEPRVCRLEWGKKRKCSKGNSVSLQNRFSLSKEKSSNRNRREFPQESFRSEKGQEKDQSLGVTGVVSVQVLEQRDSGLTNKNSKKGNFVYTLSVEDGSYLANGLLVKNCQDLNRCQQALAKKAGRRLIFCGDNHQAIYGFAGADAESMDRLETELAKTDEGCITLPLTVTRRCGFAIVEEAKKIVPGFEAHEDNGEGLIRKMHMNHNAPNTNGYYPNFAQDGDMILCRVNAPLVSECFRFISAGKKATIRGRDIGKALITTIKKMKATSIADLVSSLSHWVDSETNKEQAKKRPSETRLIALQDRYDCLCCFIEGQTTVDGVIKRIESIFTDDKDKPGVLLSSIHKAKGLEANRVFLLEPKGATVPHPMAKSAWQKEQEMNLKYIAITRAKHEFVYVS